ncbi:hypothetical protein [Corynebacterium falsenii]|uniref:hypothetical protein n=1 Tax=Corynebacterium falsenii TaxID=108486 RepID=UPI001DF8A668|nr:hypothetical protein [Corynebacterium falsenii]HJF12386.1 hypothetical protein [Corynebacterium falsenii]
MTSPLVTEFIVAQAERGGPRGVEFGKAAPIGLFIIVVLVVVILLLGFNMNQRIRRLERRRAFADKHGIDLFDNQKLDAAMEAEGYTESAGESLFARTEVPQTDSRFLPSSGVLTGPDAIDAERAAQGERGGVDDDPTPQTRRQDDDNRQ